MHTHDSSSSLRDNLQNIRARIDNATKNCGRNSAHVQLVAVSKKIPTTQMREAIDAGQVVFGESYVQEGTQKHEELGESVRLDFIGHLQRNKAKQAVGCFGLIHSVDSLALAKKISSVATQQELVQDILVQVNVSSEPQKSGVSLAEAENLCREVVELEGVQLQGLMIIGQWMPKGVDLDMRRAEFCRTRELRDRISQSTGLALSQLSMGMSSDFELAIEEGATLVRVGTALFGSRL